MDLKNTALAQHGRRLACLAFLAEMTGGTHWAHFELLDGADYKRTLHSYRHQELFKYSIEIRSFYIRHNVTFITGNDIASYLI
ncbi:MAG TPA: hypothetical protein VGT41_00015 [Candidatus Babeliales bacterium]|nr:hypothetical protein [Candidatus Babeliales bacterium]